MLGFDVKGKPMDNEKKPEKKPFEQVIEDMRQAMLEGKLPNPHSIKTEDEIKSIFNPLVEKFLMERGWEFQEFSQTAYKYKVAQLATEIAEGIMQDQLERHRQEIAVASLEAQRQAALKEMGVELQPETGKAAPAYIPRKTEVLH